MRAQTGRRDAEVLALKALTFLADSPADLDRFMAQSGLAPADMRGLAGDRGFLSGVVDFLLSEDALLMRFCACESIDPGTMHLARAALSTLPPGRK